MNIFGLKISRKPRPLSVSELAQRFCLLEDFIKETILNLDKRISDLTTIANRLEKRDYRAGKTLPTNGEKDGEVPEIPLPPEPVALQPGDTPPPGYLT